MSTHATLDLMQPLAKPSETSEADDPSSLRTNKTLSDASPKLCDEHLLEAVANGEGQALSLLFRRHGGSVLGVARRILRNGAEAEDLQQDVFLYLFRNASLYDARKCSAISWIMQITYHRAFNRRKFLNLREGDRVEVFDEQQADCSVTQPSTDQIDGKAILGRLRDQLTAPQRETLELHFFEGYTFREIAERSGQSIGNVRHHYYRALDILRSNLFSKNRGGNERIGGHLHRKGN
jgi:RNA polymerase sigma-70 factor, ECF subfamily